ncbi:MAG: SIMPL domain-containing protein [Pseudomonadota bacterium]|nr:SIMPL domain-containing protein [Pseudomonadota bacterium]
MSQAPLIPYRAYQRYRTSPFQSLLLIAGLAATVAASAQSPLVPPAGVSQTANGSTLLSVSAQAEARRVPDIASVSTGVVVQAPDASDAMRANAEQMTRVIAAIRKAGIAERDIQTSGINLNPQYRYADDQPPVITGYQASNTVQVTVRDLARLGSTLDALVAVGANQINGPSLDVDDKQSAYDEARRSALEKAQQRARMYADALGMKVRRIVSISEGGNMGPPMPMMAMARMEKSSDTSVSPGENTLSANLDVVFELER